MIVLVVEDDEIISEGLSISLEQEGYQVLKATSQAQALELINSEVSYSTKALTTIVNYAMSEEGTIQVEIESDFLATIPMNSQDQAEYEELKDRVLNDKSVASCIEYYNGSFLGRGDKRILSREYLEAYTGIMEAYGISKEEQEQYINNLQPHVNFIGIDDALLSEIVKMSGADQNIMYDENVRPVIIGQNGEMSTENTFFAGSKEPDMLQTICLRNISHSTLTCFG